MNRNVITANELNLGLNGTSAVTVQNPGTLNVNYLYLANGTTYQFTPTDSVGNLSMGNGDVTTAETSSILHSASVYGSGATLNLGANMSLSSYTTDGLFIPGALSVGNGATLDMHGFTVNSPDVNLGSATILDRATITAANLYISGGGAFNFMPSDSTGYLSVSGSTVTTAATGNITGSVDLFSGSTLNLNANLNLSGNLWLYGFEQYDQLQWLLGE